PDGQAVGRLSETAVPDLEAARDRPEDRLQVGADGRHRRDGGDRDQRRDQPIFDCGGAVFVLEQPNERGQHGRLLLGSLTLPIWTATIAKQLNSLAIPTVKSKRRPRNIAFLEQGPALAPIFVLHFTCLADF